jgi:hypothetical protein
LRTVRIHDLRDTFACRQEKGHQLRLVNH